MALNTTSQWWVFPAGSGASELNGGGFDPSYGEGTNYANQDAPELSLSDFATSGAGSAVLTSAIGGFTSAMVRNYVRIASGTNFTAGYYRVDVFTDSNTVTLDRSPTPSGAGSGGVGRLGGAHASLLNYANGGAGLGTPAIASPIAAGHIINVRGAGSDDPASGSPDYDYDAGYFTFPNGSDSTGVIRILGYNGRPCLHTSPLLGYTTDHWHLENLKLVANASTYAGESFWNGNSMGRNLYCENGGFDMTGWRGRKGVVSSRFVGTGAASTATDRPAIQTGNYAGIISHVFIKGWRADGIRLVVDSAQVVLWSTVVDVGQDCIRIEGSANVGCTVIGNTLDSPGRDCVRVTTAQALGHITAFNNIFSNAGAYGWNNDFGSAAANDLIPTRIIDWNNFYNNTSGARRNFSARTNDTALDPQYTNAASDDYRVGANMRAAGFPATAFPGAHTSYRSYVDMGAGQREEPVAESPMPVRRRVVPI